MDLCGDVCCLKSVEDTIVENMLDEREVPYSVDVAPIRRLRVSVGIPVAEVDHHPEGRPCLCASCCPIAGAAESVGLKADLVPGTVVEIVSHDDVCERLVVRSPRARDSLSISVDRPLVSHCNAAPHPELVPEVPTATESARAIFPLCHSTSGVSNDVLPSLFVDAVSLVDTRVRVDSTSTSESPDHVLNNHAGYSGVTKKK